jgi:hypothetical protein
VAEDKTPLEEALDLLVYAPLGLALTARDELPRFIARGRLQVTGQVALAKMIGQFAVTQGQREAKRRAAQLFDQVGEMAERLASGARATPPPAPATGPLASAGPDHGNGARTTRRPPDGMARPRTTGAIGATASARSAIDPGAVAQLAIPGYDSLSAPQVVQRLAGLSADELEAVRHYEAATRSRRTILSKVAQLQTDQPRR